MIRLCVMLKSQLLHPQILAALAKSGHGSKVLISDGNDTDSQASLREVKQLIRESEVLVYAIGIDGQAEGTIFGLPPTTRGHS